ncbi:MAG: hypothetical protein RMJ06_06165 [Nitrososphaerota archaeon]|nr:hypothetical protein [Nitrososphaerota archaeon]
MSDDEEIDEIVRKLNERVETSPALLLVEGEKDRERVTSRGFRGQVLTLYELMSRVESYERVEVIVLLDLDRQGEELLGYLRRRLGPNVKLDEEFRNSLRRTRRFRMGYRSIEELFKRRSGQN